MTPKVSIIIPAYNAQAYIEEAIGSALRQSLHDLEVIVIDDGSIDQTAQVVKRNKDTRVRVIQQENRGQSAAINTGVEHSSGTYIKLLDADDWINPKHLESQLSAIGGRQDLVASCRWGYFIDKHMNPMVKPEFTNKDYDKPLEWIIDSLTRDEGMMGGWMWLIPRSLWDKVGGFDPRLNLNNDFHFSIKLLLASEGVRFAENAVYSYRKGLAGALSGSSGQKAMESAYVTTELGTALLLAQEDSPRVRQICADRFQRWLFCFYPEFPDLFARAKERIEELGGSNVKLDGGVILKILKPVIGWKGVRRLQAFVYKYGWNVVLKKKTASRMRKIH